MLPPNSMSETVVTRSELSILLEKGYNLDKVIGEGSYAKVFKAMQMVNETKHNWVACKVIDTNKAPRDYLTKFLPRELDILIRVSHPHIMDVSAIFQRRNKYFVFLRFAENGDLLDFLTQNGAIPENQTRLWMRQIISGLEYLHAIHIAHRDLKCENILITQNYNVKITDFGFARHVWGMEKEALSETYCGSLSYAAPEVLKGVPYLPKPADMWSMGIILYTMLNKALPFNETSVKKLHEKQVLRKWRFRTAVVNDLSLQVRKQVTHLLEPEPNLRPSATAVFTGVWMNMDATLSKRTFVEETLLKQAAEENSKRSKDNDDESEAERIAELRRKTRKSEGLRVLKTTDPEMLLANKSKQIFLDRHP